MQGLIDQELRCTSNSMAVTQLALCCIPATLWQAPLVPSRGLVHWRWDLRVARQSWLAWTVFLLVHNREWPNISGKHWCHRQRLPAMLTWPQVEALWRRLVAGVRGLQALHALGMSLWWCSDAGGPSVGGTPCPLIHTVQSFVHLWGGWHV